MSGRLQLPLLGRCLAVLAALTAAVAVGACGGSADGGASSAGSGDSTTKLRFAYFGGQNDPHGRLWAWWMDEVEKRTEGKVTFEPFFEASLLDATEMVDGLKDSRVDIATVAPTYYAESFPLTNVAELPFVTENVPAGSQAFAKLGETSEPLKQEWDKLGLKPVAFNAGPGSAIGTKKPIRTVADLDGLRLRALDRGSKIFGEHGANLVNVGLTELYSSMQRNLVNGYYGIPFAFAGPTKLVEVTNHLTDPGFGLAAMSALAMSRDGWNRLPEDVRTVMAEVSGQVPEKQAEFLAAAEDETCAGARENDVKLSVLPETEVAKLRAGQAKVKQQWVEQAAEKDLPGAEFYEQYTAAIAEAEQDYTDYETGLKRCLAGADSAATGD